MKKKSLLITILVLIAVLCLTFSACQETTVDKLQNDYGVTVEGGVFDKDAVLVTTKVEPTSGEGKQVLDAIADVDYNKNADVYIFDVYITNDGVKVQPDGKVKVTIPLPDQSITACKVLHVKENNQVETLTPTIAYGKLSFETSSFSYFVLVQELTNQPCTHDFFDWDVAIEATCQQDGQKYRTCRLCKEQEFETIPALGHDLTQHQGKEATCLEGGYKAYEACSRCNYTTYEEIPALGHADAKWNEGKEPTCTEEGIVKHYHCDRCQKNFDANFGEIASLTIPVVPHEYGDMYYELAPDFFRDGNIAYYQCGTCKQYFDEQLNRVDTVVIPKLSANLSICVNGTPTALVIEEQTDNHIIWTLEGLSVTKGDVITICQTDKTEITYNYSAEGNVGRDGKIITTAVANVVLTATPNGLMLNISGYKYEGVVIQINGVQYPMDFVTYPDGEQTSYVYGYVEFAVGDKFVIVDNVSGTIYDFDDLDEAFLWNTWDYHRGDNDEFVIDFGARYGIEFDNNGNKKIYISKAFGPYDGESFGVVFEGERADEMLTSIELPTEGGVNNEFMWTLKHCTTMNNGDIVDYIDQKGLWFYYTMIDMEVGEKFSLKNFTTSELIGADHLVDIAGDITAITREGDLVSVQKSGSFHIIYLPAFNSFTIECDTSDPLAEVNLYAGNDVVTLVPDENGDIFYNGFESKTYHIIAIDDARYSPLPIILDESMDKTLVTLTNSDGTCYANPTKDGIYNLRYNVHTNVLYLEFVGGAGSEENPTDNYLYSLMITNGTDNTTLSMEINPDNPNEVCYKGANVPASYFVGVMEVAKDGSSSNSYGALAGTDASIAVSYGTIAMVKIGGTYDVYFDAVAKTIRLVPATGSGEEDVLPKDIYIDETTTYALVGNANNAEELCYLGLVLESYDDFRIRDTKDNFIADLTLSAGTTGAQTTGASIMVENDGTYNIYINKTTHEVRIELVPRGDCPEGECVYDQGVVTKAPTHLEEGVRTFTCTICGKTKDEPIAKTSGHEFGDWMPDKDNPSKHYRECGCGEVETADCEFNQGVVTKEPTHLEEGVRTLTCTICGSTKDEPIATIGGHEFGDWTPDELEETKHYKQCDCGEVETADCTFVEGVCTVCGREQAQEDGIIIVVAGGTATFVGKETAVTYSNVYGENANVYVAQENDVLNVTLTDQAGRVFKHWASAQGTIIPDEDFAMLVLTSGYYYPVFEDTDEAEFTNRVKIADGNCEEGDLYMSTNSKGDIKYELEFEGYGRHDFGGWEKHNNQYHKQVCYICGEAIFEEHTDHERETVKEPTHTEEGLRRCTCYCGYSWTEAIPPTEEHNVDYDDWHIVEESKNGQYGKYKVYCKYCDYSEEYWYLDAIDFVSFIDGKMINYQYTYGGKVVHDEYYYSYRNAEGKKVYIWAIQYEYERSSNADNNDTYIFMYIDDENSSTIEPIYLSKSRGNTRAEYLWAIYGYAYDVNGWIEILDSPDLNIGCENGMLLGNSMSARSSVFESYHNYWAETYNKLRIPTSKAYNDFSDSNAGWEVEYEGTSFTGGYTDENGEYVTTGGRDIISFVKDRNESYKKYMHVDKATGITYGYEDYTSYRTIFIMRSYKTIVSPEEYEQLDEAGKSVSYSYGSIESDIKSLCSKRTLFNNFTLTLPETTTAFRFIFSDPVDCVEVSGSNTSVYNNSAHVYNSGSPITLTWVGEEGIVFDRYEIWDFANQKWVVLSEQSTYIFNTADNPRRSAAYVRVVCHEVEIPVDPSEMFRITVENGYFYIDGTEYTGTIEVAGNTLVYVYANDVAGKNFDHWVDDNGQEMYDSSFTVTSNIILTPVYVDATYTIYAQGWNYDAWVNVDGGEMHYTNEFEGKVGDKFELSTKYNPEYGCDVFIGWYREDYGKNGSEYIFISDSQTFTYEITGKETGYIYAVWTTGENPMIKKYVDIRVTDGFVSYSGGEGGDIGGGVIDNAYSAISLSNMGMVTIFDDPTDATVYTAWDVAYRYELEGEVMHDTVESYQYDEDNYYPARFWVSDPQSYYPDGQINITATIIDNGLEEGVEEDMGTV